MNYALDNAPNVLELLEYLDKRRKTRVRPESLIAQGAGPAEPRRRRCRHKMG